MTPVDNTPQEGWNLVLEFDDQSLSFAQGFEAGRVFQSMVSDRSLGTEANPVAITKEGLPFIEKIAASQFYEVVSTPPDENGWTQVFFVKKKFKPQVVK